MRSGNVSEYGNGRMSVLSGNVYDLFDGDDIVGNAAMHVLRGRIQTGRSHGNMRRTELFGCGICQRQRMSAVFRYNFELFDVFGRKHLHGLRERIHAAKRSMRWRQLSGGNVFEYVEKSGNVRFLLFAVRDLFGIRNIVHRLCRRL